MNYLSLFQQQRQNFSLPDPIVLYVAKNVPSPILYQKIINCCKYFVIQNPILTVHCLIYIGKKLREICSKTGIESSSKTCRSSCFGKTAINLTFPKIWVTNYLQITGFGHVERFSLPKNILCNITELSISDKIISLDELIKIGTSVKICTLLKVTVQNKEKNQVSITVIIENLPSLENLTFIKFDSSHISKTTATDFLKSQKFKTLKKLDLCSVSEDFDIEEFYRFFKNNKTMDIHLYFRNDISAIFRQKLKKMTEKILKLGECWPPYFYISSPQLQIRRSRPNHLTDAHKKYVEKKGCYCDCY